MPQAFGDNMPLIRSINIFPSSALGFGNQQGKRVSLDETIASKKSRNLDGLAVIGDQTKSEPSASAPGFYMKDIERLA